MKKNTMTLLGILFFVVTGCQNELENETFFSNQEDSFVNSRNTTSWFNCNECILPSGAEVYLPWSTTAITSIPDEIREDVKEEDGWKILFTTVDISGYSETVTDADNSANYLLLYNRYTGMLKGFYYAEGNMQKNNNAYWLLTISGGTKLFNFVPYFAEPINSSNSPRQISLSTVSTNGITNGFDVGWNCFMQELAYDENSMNERLSISCYALNQSTITFNGSYNSSSEGTIVSTTQGTSSDIKGVAKSFGTAASGWIMKSSGATKAIKSTKISDALGKGLASLVSAGINKIFASFLGSSNSVSTENIQFSTNGSVTIKGTSQTPSTGYISPLAGIPLNGIGENLGVWNLAQTPKHIAFPYAILKDIKNAQTGSDYTYNLTFSQSFSVVKNPAIDVALITSSDVVNYDKHDGVNVTFGTINNKASKFAYRVSSPSVLYSDAATVIKDNSNSYNVVIRDLLPNKTYGSDSPAYDLSQNGVSFWENTAISVKVKLNKGDVTTYSTKTFIPNYEFGTGSARPYSWTYQELINKGF